MFLRKSRIDPLPVMMSAVRMGERVLQVGIPDPTISSAIAAKVGLSGHAAIAVTDESDAARARHAAASSGTLVDVHVTPSAPLPFDNAAFDLVIAHGMAGSVSSLDEIRRAGTLREWHRVLRPGGRVMTIEAGTSTGLKAWLKPARGSETVESAGGMAGALRTAGFQAVRIVGDREGYKFTEGVKI